MGFLKRVLVNGSLLAASSILALLLGEAALRLFRPIQYLKPPRRTPAASQEESLYRPSSVPGLSFELVPGRNGTFEGMQVRTNSHGMRGGEPAAGDPALIRIVVLGDSFTFGFGVPEEQTYPRILERLLNESSADRGHRFEVLNAGVVGYTARDEAVVLERKALLLKPKGVILGYVLNDPETDPRQSLHKHFDEPTWWRHFHALRLLHLGWNRLEVRRFGEGDYIRYLHARDREKWSSVLDAFRRIREATRPRGIHVVIVIFPLVPSRKWDGYPYRDLHRQVGQAAEENGFQALDLWEVFSRYEPRRLRLSARDDHPSPLAHELAARAIQEKLLAEN